MCFLSRILLCGMSFFVLHLTFQNEEQFVWSDKYPVLYTNWVANETLLSNFSGLCVKLSVSDTGRWVSENCLQELPYTCKYIESEKPVYIELITNKGIHI